MVNMALIVSTTSPCYLGDKHHHCTKHLSNWDPKKSRKLVPWTVSSKAVPSLLMFFPFLHLSAPFLWFLLREKDCGAVCLYWRNVSAFTLSTDFLSQSCLFLVSLGYLCLISHPGNCLVKEHLLDLQIYHTTFSSVYIGLFHMTGRGIVICLHTHGIYNDFFSSDKSLWLSISSMEL